jgi:hypothetical protein
LIKSKQPVNGDNDFVALSLKTSPQERGHLRVILDYQNLHKDDSSPIQANQARKRPLKKVGRFLAFAI